MDDFDDLYSLHPSHFSGHDGPFHHEDVLHHSHEFITEDGTVVVFECFDHSGWEWGSHIESLSNLGTSHDSEHVTGHPLEDMQHWHQQTHPDTCAVVSQEFILDELTGHDFSEETLAQEAYAHGWYTPGAGTPMDDVGNLLELHGISIEREYNASIDDLSAELDQNHKVIVAVNAETLWDNASGNAATVGHVGFIPGQNANHAVEVIGFDHTDALNPMVILNDPGCANGCGILVPLTAFEAAWGQSGHYMVHTVDGQQVTGYPPVYEPQLAGYYNSDGTYHWTSDNTDRDPETGSVVRYY